MPDECIFCKIIKGQIPSKTVYESNTIKAFLDIFPIAEGHTLVVPKKHYYNLLDMPENEIGPFFLELKNIAHLLQQKLKADGFNIVQNNFPAAGQVVPHFHYHIIPRKNEDNAIKFKIPKTQATNDQLESVLKKIHT